MTDEQIEALEAAAHAGRRRGWRPYSKFPVAAAVLTTEGRVYGGAGNVECANYTLTKHAEETAVIAALADGALERNGRVFVRAVYLATAGLPGADKQKCTPCGGCRQFLWEFSDDETEVIMELPAGGREIKHLRELLPDPFGPADLHVTPADSPRE